jgi:hypothetical protein
MYLHLSGYQPSGPDAVHVNNTHRRHLTIAATVTTWPRSSARLAIARASRLQTGRNARLPSTARCVAAPQQRAPVCASHMAHCPGPAGAVGPSPRVASARSVSRPTSQGEPAGAGGADGARAGAGRPHAGAGAGAGAAGAGAGANLASVARSPANGSTLGRRVRVGLRSLRFRRRSPTSTVPRPMAVVSLRVVSGRRPSPGWRRCR